MFNFRAKFFLALLFISHTLNSQSLHLSISSNPSRINPILATDSVSATISGYIFNGLFKYDKNGKIICDLAKEYRFITDTQLQIKLKQNIKWHDGEQFTVDDVIFTYNTVTSDKIFTPYANDFVYVKKVEKIAQCCAKKSKIIGAKDIFEK